MFGAPGANAGVNAVVQGPKGYVAVGYDGTGARLEAAAWTSTDATDWTRVPSSADVVPPSAEEGLVMNGLTYARHTYVAVGFRRRFDTAGRVERLSRMVPGRQSFEGCNPGLALAVRPLARRPR